MMYDPVFGEIEFNGFTWEKNIRLDFCGKEHQIILMISGDEDGEFEDGQYEAYKVLMARWGDIHQSFLAPILNYYNKKRSELGYDKLFNEDYPEINTPTELLQNIEIVGLVITYANIYGNRSVGITFDCTWDRENGIGLQLNDENIIDVGYQDITM